RSGECRARQDARRLDVPIAPAVSRAPQAAISCQQQVIRIPRADRQRERAAYEDARVDRRPRGADVMSTEDPTQSVRVMGGRLLRSAAREQFPPGMFHQLDVIGYAAVYEVGS